MRGEKQLERKSPKVNKILIGRYLIREEDFDSVLNDQESGDHPQGLPRSYQF